MGGADAVGWAPKGHRRMLQIAFVRPEEPSLSELLASWRGTALGSEIRKDWSSPFDHSSERNHGFSIAIDILNEIGIFDALEATNLSDSRSEFMAARETLYMTHGSLDSPKDRVDRQESLTSLGLRACGVRGRR